jgi:hypothetical protein
MFGICSPVATTNTLQLTAVVAAASEVGATSKMNPRWPPLLVLLLLPIPELVLPFPLPARPKAVELAPERRMEVTEVLYLIFSANPGLACDGGDGRMHGEMSN